MLPPVQYTVWSLCELYVCVKDSNLFHVIPVSNDVTKSNMLLYQEYLFCKLVACPHQRLKSFSRWLCRAWSKTTFNNKLTNSWRHYRGRIFQSIWTFRCIFSEKKLIRNKQLKYQKCFLREGKWHSSSMPVNSHPHQIRWVNVCLFTFLFSRVSCYNVDCLLSVHFPWPVLCAWRFRLSFHISFMSGSLLWEEQLVILMTVHYSWSVTRTFFKMEKWWQTAKPQGYIKRA